MDITLLHVGLAGGAALAVVPLILHLVMRQTPKRIVFPALRLLQNRHRQSTKRLRVKNWLLLLARMALVALMALALARPALNARVPLGDQEVPTAMVLVIDTSLSMGYTDLGKTRLEEAIEVARTLLGKLPETSQVTIIDSGAPAAGAPVSPSAARKRLDGLTLRAASRPLNQAIEQAYASLRESRSELPRQEVYILTDLARSSWDPAQPIRGREEAEKTSRRDISTYVIRLAPEQLGNVALIDVTVTPTASNEAGQGELFEIKGTARNSGPEGSWLVEFLLDGKKRDQTELKVPADGEADVRFTTPPNLDPGVHQATLRVRATDSMPHDDIRFVTFQSRPAYDVLVVYDPDPNDALRTIDAHFIAKALDPLGIGRPCRVEPIGTNQISGGRFTQDLSKYACVFVNNVQRLPDACWNQLAIYVRQGGGVVIGLGNRVDIDHYNGEAASAVLPVRLVAAQTPPGGITSFGTILDPAHPLFSPLTRELGADLAAIPVMKHMRVTMAEGSGARALLAFQDGSPAMIERTLPGAQTGHVFVWTTPLSRRAEPGDPDAWNEFPIAGWSFLALMDRTIPYVAGSSGIDLNYLAGEFVRLPLASGQRATSFVVQGPEADQTERVSPPQGSSELVVEGAQSLGHWRVQPSGEQADPTARLGFSINPDPAESSFTPLAEDDLNTLFGTKDAYALADNAANLKRVQRTARVGRELFPWIMAMILVLVTAENYLANRFHRERGTASVLRPRAMAAGAR